VNWGDLLLQETAWKFFDVSKVAQRYSGAIFGGSVLSSEWFAKIPQNANGHPTLFASCGARNAKPFKFDTQRITISGVRGHLSKKIFTNQAVTGDPGLASPILMGVFPSFSSRNTILHVPHFSEKFALKAQKVSTISTLRPRGESSRYVLAEIAKSNFVVAGSLHAAVCAISLGTPFCFYRANTGEDDFKFLDFASLFEVELLFSLELNDAKEWYISNSGNFRDIKKFVESPYSECLLEYAAIASNQYAEKVKRYLEVRNEIFDLKLSYLNRELGYTRT